MSAFITVDKEDPLVDEVIKINIKGLQKNQHVTVRAEVIEKGQVFAGSGCFVADDNGTVDISKQPSTCGTYKGVFSMGLFWSMRSSPNMPPGLRLIKNNASSPLVTDITVFLGHLTFEQTYNSNVKPMLQKTIRRWYMARGVQKVRVRSGRIRGTLFLPPGQGPFPGVIDMFGIVGSCVEFRAALLASRGFAALALPYFLYDDLPKNLSELEFEYFMEAIDWLSTHPHVNGNNLGVIGVSKGGELALQMGYYSNKIKSVVSINGAPFFSVIPLKYKGDFIGVSDFDPDNFTETEEGLDVRNTMNCDTENYLPIWERDVHVLLISGQDDKQLKQKFLPNLFKCYPADRKHLCELHVYPGAGHLIEPPYAPLARSTIKYNRGVLGDYGRQRLLWGGETVAHAHAQEDSWRHIIDHFRRTLSSTPQTKEENAANSKL
ncbi:acyl-coenzyme A thioesterase 1-like [Mercenaria mercenaria]|uniref:acyl-coenzyme A thioesterase 1-like n=1 Tax=Mercenaria mercenaria TaxID=6596 RepID=UPI00234FA929|nr:acyl-coenzyme A thioesterase 1-like [Mercenaria mercenaria]